MTKDQLEVGVPSLLLSFHSTFISSIITQYQVRWIEMAAVLPYWTCMIVYYVEGDRGHLMNEVLKENQHRAAVRGQAFSFIMPWDEIVKSLHQRIRQTCVI